MINFLFSHWLGGVIRFAGSIFLWFLLNGFINAHSLENTFISISEFSRFNSARGLVDLVVYLVVYVIVILSTPIIIIFRGSLVSSFFFGFIMDMPKVQKVFAVFILLCNLLFIYQVIFGISIYPEITFLGWDISQGWRTHNLIETSKFNFLWNHLLSLAGYYFTLFFFSEENYGNF